MEVHYLHYMLRITAVGWSAPVKRGIEVIYDPALTPPATQYGATRSNPEQRKKSGRFGQEEYNLLMLHLSYKEFVAAQQ